MYCGSLVDHTPRRMLRHRRLASRLVWAGVNGLYPWLISCRSRLAIDIAIRIVIDLRLLVWSANRSLLCYSRPLLLTARMMTVHRQLLSVPVLIMLSMLLRSILDRLEGVRLVIQAGPLRWLLNPLLLRQRLVSVAIVSRHGRSLVTRRSARSRRRRSGLFATDSTAHGTLAASPAFLLLRRKCRERGILSDRLWLGHFIVYPSFLLCLPLFHCCLLQIRSCRRRRWLFP